MRQLEPAHCIDRYGPNVAGRDLVVGDVHGHFSRLRKALRRIRFDESVDRLFCLGDLVDRGPESAEAFDWLARPWLRSILGNHERAAIDWARDELDEDVYAQNGGTWNIGVSAQTRQARARTFAMLPVAIELETAAGLVGLVHADVPASSWEEFRRKLRAEAGGNGATRETLEAAVNSRGRLRGNVRGPVQGVRAVIAGHSLLDQPRWVDNVLHIETGGWSDGQFTIIDAGTLGPAGRRL